MWNEAWMFLPILMVQFFFLLFLRGSSNQFQFFQRTVPLRRNESRQLFHKVAILWHHIKGVMSRYFRVLMGDECDVESFTDNTIVTSQTRWIWGKQPLSRLLAINLKKVGPIFFTITQMQSYSISSICVHRCFSFLLLDFIYVVRQF